MNISELIQIHTIGYHLQDVKVNFGYDVKIDAPEVSIEAKHGEILSVPRWMANVLSQEKLGEIQDNDMASELKQTISKENAQGEFSLSTLSPEFYIRLNEYLTKTPLQDQDKLASILNTLVRIRQRKIMALTDSSKMTAEIAKKLTVEEKIFFDNVYAEHSKFKRLIMGMDK